MKTILICDDDPFILGVAKIILTQKGYKVYTLDNCELSTLLKKITKVQPNLILMDLIIPPIGGAATIKLLKNNVETKNIPIIVFSANSNIETITVEIQANGYIKKPFDIMEFEHIVEDFMVGVEGVN